MDLKIITITLIVLYASGSMASVREWIEAERIGAIQIKGRITTHITPDMNEIIKQLVQHQPRYENPVIIFSGDEIMINDKDILEEVISISSDTLTSL